MLAQSLLFLSLMAALFMAFRVHPFSVERQIDVDDLLLTARRNAIIAGRPSRIKRLRSWLSHLLQQSRLSGRSFVQMLLACAGGGFFVGLLIFSVPQLALMTGLAMTITPFIYALLMIRHYRSRELEDLENMMSTVTLTYISNDNIVASFEDYLNRRNKGIDPRLRSFGPLDAFLTDFFAVDPSVENGLRKLQAKINNRFFDEWIDMLILCQGHRELKFALQPVVKQMNDAKVMQMEANTVYKRIWRNYLSILAMMYAVIPIVRFANVVWYNILVYTPQGQLMILLMILATILTSMRMLHVTRPLD